MKLGMQLENGRWSIWCSFKNGQGGGRFSFMVTISTSVLLSHAREKETIAANHRSLFYSRCEDNNKAQMLRYWSVEDKER